MGTHYWTSSSSTTFSTAGNWSDGVAPANGDTLIFNYLGTANVAGAATGLTGCTIIVEESYSGQIGSLSGATASYLTFDGFTCYVGQRSGGGTASGPQLVMIGNSGSNPATWVVYNTNATSATNYFPPVMTKGSATTANVYGGGFGAACLPGETCALTLNLLKSGGDSVNDPSAYLGSGVTAAAVRMNAGTVFSRSDNTATAVTLEDDAAEYEYQGSGAHTTLTCWAGTVESRGTGTITTLNLGGVFNRNKDARAATITTANFYDGATFDIDNGVPGSTTVTTKNLIDCGMQGVTFRTPKGDLL